MHLPIIIYLLIHNEREYIYFFYLIVCECVYIYIYIHTHNFFYQLYYWSCDQFLLEMQINKQWSSDEREKGMMIEKKKIKLLDNLGDPTTNRIIGIK